jgi:hypothetical protein
MAFDIGECCYNLSTHFNFGWNLTKITGTSGLFAFLSVGSDALVIPSRRIATQRICSQPRYHVGESPRWRHNPARQAPRIRCWPHKPLKFSGESVSRAGCTPRQLETTTQLQLLLFFCGKPFASWMRVHKRNQFSVSCSVVLRTKGSSFSYSSVSCATGRELNWQDIWSCFSVEFPTFPAFALQVW